MNVSICIPSYGENVWQEMAETRAVPSAHRQEPLEVLTEHDPEGTVASVRNALGRRAKGEWLCFLDADDELAAGFLVAMQRAWERRSRGGGGAPDGPPPLLTPAVSYVRNGKRQTPRLLPVGNLRHNNYLVVGTLVQRDLFLQVGGFENYPHGFEDWSLWAKCWKAGAKVVPVRRAIYIAHVNPNSKHRTLWRDRAHQAEWHERIQRDLFPA